jgi:hypothetical protein
MPPAAGSSPVAHPSGPYSSSRGWCALRDALRTWQRARRPLLCLVRRRCTLRPGRCAHRGGEPRARASGPGVPEQPSGWSSAIAPPFEFTRSSGSTPHPSSVASACAANASLTQDRATRGAARRPGRHRCLFMQLARGAGYLAHPRRAPPFVHASERRRVMASDARSGRRPGARGETPAFWRRSSPGVPLGAPARC